MEPAENRVAKFPYKTTLRKVLKYNGNLKYYQDLK